MLKSKALVAQVEGIVTAYRSTIFTVYALFIMLGGFGRIFKGRIIQPTPVTPYTEVAIKTPKSTEETSDQEIEDFIAESAIMLDFHHPNVLSLVGVIFDTTGHLPVIVLPFMAHGYLRSYLRSKTLTSSSSSSFDSFPEVSFDVKYTNILTAFHLKCLNISGIE